MAGRYQKVTPSRVGKNDVRHLPENTLLSVSIPYAVAKKIKHSVTLDVHRRDAHSRSFASEMGRPRDVRFPSDSGRPADISAGPKIANKRPRSNRYRDWITMQAAFQFLGLGIGLATRANATPTHGSTP
jgi:hypothetical protein